MPDAAQLRIAVIEDAGRVEIDRALETETGAGRRVMMAAAEALHEAVPIQGFEQVTGEPAVGAERGDPGVLGARAPVVSVARGDDSDPVARLEGIEDDPLERAPGGVDFDRGLEFRVVGVLDVGIAAADVRRDQRVLVLECSQEISRRMTIGLRMGRVVDEGPAGSVDGAALVPVPDVVVAPEGSVARPLVAGQGDETAGLVELGGQLIELSPERVGDLEIVALMATDIEKRPVTGECEVVAGGVGADGLFALSVEVAPVVAVCGAGRDPEGVRLRETDALFGKDPDPPFPGIGDGETVHLPGELSRRERHRLGQPVEGTVGRQTNRSIHPVARVAPLVLALEAEAEAVPLPAQGRKDGEPLQTRSGPDVDGRLSLVRKRNVLVAREGIGEHAKLERRLDECLEPQPWRALPAVAEADDDPVSLGEIPVAAHVERDPPGTNVAAVFAAGGERNPLEVSTVVNPGAVGSSHWIVDWSVWERNTTLRLPRSSIPNLPHV